MKSASFFALAGLFVATAAMTFTASGCNKPVEKDKDKDKDASVKTDPPKDPVKKEPIKAGTGTIKGKFVYADALPKIDEIPELLKNDDCAKCKLPADKEYMKCYQKWIVGKDKGVANVLVRLKVPEGKYFEASESDLKERKTQKVTIDQPCCAFEPHVAVLYPDYFDGKKLKPTGQVLLVKNSAPFLHNTKIMGNGRVGNEKPSKSLEANIGSAEFVLAPEVVPINVACDAHPWMNAKLFAFDHPYAAVTGIDGTFVIKNVPNQKLIVEFWHEEKGWFDPTEVDVKADETKTLDKTISAK
jgi:hypothetical protein